MYISPNVPDHDTADLCDKMGIPRTIELGKYLGHRLIHGGRGGMGFEDLLQK